MQNGLTLDAVKASGLGVDGTAFIFLFDDLTRIFKGSGDRVTGSLVETISCKVTLTATSGDSGRSRDTLEMKNERGSDAQA